MIYETFWIYLKFNNDMYYCEIFFYNFYLINAIVKCSLYLLVLEIFLWVSHYFIRLNNNSRNVHSTWIIGTAMVVTVLSADYVHAYHSFTGFSNIACMSTCMLECILSFNQVPSLSLLFFNYDVMLMYIFLQQFTTISFILGVSRGFIKYLLHKGNKRSYTVNNCYL